MGHLLFKEAINKVLTPTLLFNPPKRHCETGMLWDYLLVPGYLNTEIIVEVTRLLLPLFYMDILL